MKPITKGEGQESYSLFFPFWVRDDASPIDVNLLVRTLGESLPKYQTQLYTKNNGVETLRISEIPSVNDAEKVFLLIKKTLLYLAIESDVAIYAHDRILSLDESVKINFFPDWIHAKESGWNISESNGMIQADAIAHTIYPLVVPDHKKVVDSGAIHGRIRRHVKNELIKKAIDLSIGDASEFRIEKVELASRAYINAISHENQSLKFLSFVTCLEILSEKHEKSESYVSVVDAAIDAVKSLDLTGDENRAAIESIASKIGGFKIQSIKEAIESLILRFEKQIADSLPMDHPHKAAPKEAVADMYAVRSKVAHNAKLGEDQKTYRSVQFAYIAAKTILKIALFNK